jgi:hypothetical protein
MDMNDDMETREYIDEWTGEKAVTNWNSDCTTRCNQLLLSIKTEFMSKCQAKLGINERTIDAETLVRDAFKKAYNVEFSARVFDNTLPAVVAARDARKASKASETALKREMMTVSAEKLALAQAWLDGVASGKTEQKIYEVIVKSGKYSEKLLTELFPRFAKK